MYESEHNTRIIQLAYRLQHEMAKSYKPDATTIRQLCQEIENSAHEIYKWAVGIESEL